MRANLLFISILLIKLIYSQNAATLREVNTVIGPKYKVSIIDAINCGFFDNNTQNQQCAPIKKVDLDKDGFKEIIVVAHNPLGGCPNKIFILKKINAKFQIIDSSSSFCFIKGTNVEIKHDTIVLNSLIHYAGYSFIYKYNIKFHKYFLCKLKYFEIEVNNKYSNEFEQTYSLDKHLLFLRSEFAIYQNSLNDKTKKRLIKKYLSLDFPKEMSNFIDPYRDNNEKKIYNKIFLPYYDKIYKQMATY